MPASGYDLACDYPHVRIGMFERHFFDNVAGSGYGPLLDDLQVEYSPFDRSLPGTTVHVPGYNVAVSSEHGTKILTNRIAIIGIGSNCSPDILREKFRRQSVGGDFVIAQASIGEHAVTHGAFLGGKGTVPATVTPDPSSTSHITVGFFDMDQAIALTETEPNYDLVHIHQPLRLRGLPGPEIVERGALAYVSVWGSLTVDGKMPLVQEAIPQDTPLPGIASRDIVHHVARRLGHEKDPQAFFDSIPEMPVKDRIKHNFALAASAIPATIHGKQVKPASIVGECVKAEGKAPAIDYI